MKGLVKGCALKPGDSVGIAAPGAYLNEEGHEYLEQAVSILEEWGLHVKALPDLSRRHQYFAGEDRERANELMRFFTDPEVRAIFCARGGYGAQRLIPFLDARVIHNHPKIFVGSSDITVLLVYFLEQSRLIPFHGPNLATPQFLKGDSKVTQASLREALDLGFPREIPSCTPLKGGKGRGQIKGGCLSLLVTTLGTAYEIDLRGSILFAEDVNEPVYRIDRMLTHLRHAGKLDEIEGLVLGEMASCRDEEGIGLDAMILDLFKDQNLPILRGFPSGHGRLNLTVPFGVDVTLDGDRGCLRFEESGLAVQ